MSAKLHPTAFHGGYLVAGPNKELLWLRGQPRDLVSARLGLLHHILCLLNQDMREDWVPCSCSCASSTSCAAASGVTHASGVNLRKQQQFGNANWASVTPKAKAALSKEAKDIRAPHNVTRFRRTNQKIREDEERAEQDEVRRYLDAITTQQWKINEIAMTYSSPSLGPLFQ